MKTDFSSAGHISDLEKQYELELKGGLKKKSFQARQKARPRQFISKIHTAGGSKFMDHQKLNVVKSNIEPPNVFFPFFPIPSESGRRAKNLENGGPRVKNNPPIVEKRELRSESQKTTRAFSRGSYLSSSLGPQEKKEPGPRSLIGTWRKKTREHVTVPLGSFIFSSCRKSPYKVTTSFLPPSEILFPAHEKKKTGSDIPSGLFNLQISQHGSLFLSTTNLGLSTPSHFIMPKEIIYRDSDSPSTLGEKEISKLEIQSRPPPVKIECPEENLINKIDRPIE